MTCRKDVSAVPSKLEKQVNRPRSFPPFLPARRRFRLLRQSQQSFAPFGWCGQPESNRLSGERRLTKKTRANLHPHVAYKRSVRPMSPWADGAGDGTRTRNLLITNQLLCQLSYTSIIVWGLVATTPTPAGA